VLGTTSILKSALKCGAGVKRIVLTSSVAAVHEEDPTPREYDEKSWNKAAIATVASQGSATGPGVIYVASKTLAERAAWKFVDEHRAELAWDLVVLSPPLDLRGTSRISSFECPHVDGA
jgi:nucleoside-diphosphate-sugar epimerase